MYTILASATNTSPLYYNSCEKVDNTRIVVGGKGIGLPTSEDTFVYLYSWNGSTFSLLSSASLAGGSTPGSTLRVNGSKVFREGQPFYTAGGAGVAGCVIDGNELGSSTMIYYYSGMIGMDPYEYRGYVYGFDTSANYVYICGRTWTVVSFPPYVLKYVYSLDAVEWNPPASPVLRKSLSISTSTECGRVACMGGFIYLLGTPFKKYTFTTSPSYDFNFVSSATPFDIKDFGTSIYGSFFFGSTGNVISVYDTDMALVTTYDTGYTISNIRVQGSKVFVNHPSSTTRIYNFDGNNFTLLDSVPFTISNAVEL